MEGETEVSGYSGQRQEQTLGLTVNVEPPW